METKLWNRDADGFASEIPVGGLPVFTDDLQSMQDVSTELFGTLGLLKGWSCVLRGCLVDELNTQAKTVTITEGIVLINDTIYYFPGVTNQTYPFSIVKGTETVDSRIFKDAGVKDVAITFNTGIRTSFTFGSPGSTLESLMPTNLSEEEIYFDPFTAQKAEYILKSLSTDKDEVKSLASTSSVDQTETGKSVVGGSLNYLTGQGEGRWKHLGWRSYNFITQGRQFVLRNGGTTGTIGGSNSVVLTRGNIPTHTHGSGNLATGSETDSDDIATRTATGAHGHDFTGQPPTQFGSTTFFTKIPGPTQPGLTGPSIPTFIDSQTGDHNHIIKGYTSDGAVGQNIATQLKANPDSIDVKGESLSVAMFRWESYTSVQGFYKFSTEVLPFANM